MMVYYVKRGKYLRLILKLLKAEFDMLYFEKHKGQRIGRARTVNDIQTKISSLTETKN